MKFGEKIKIGEDGNNGFVRVEIPRSLLETKNLLGISALCAVQALAAIGCVGTIKPSRSAEEQRADNCEVILENMSEENSEERVACMEERKEASQKTCAALREEETDPENVNSKLDCLEYEFKTDPPENGVNVVSWH